MNSYRFDKWSRVLVFFVLALTRYPKSGPEAQCPVVLEGVQKRPRVMLYPITFTVHCPSGKAAIKTCVCKMVQHGLVWIER